MIAYLMQIPKQHTDLALKENPIEEKTLTILHGQFQSSILVWCLL